MKNWRLERDPEGIAWATLDKQGSSANTLSAEVMGELVQLLDELDGNKPKGLVFRSGKSTGFIAGADIEEFTKITSAAAAHALVQRGWNLYNRIADLKYPTLALIRGHCMGGGLELALACRYRIVVDEPGTRLALPEVMLGIVPGWGGMLRLPQKVGAAQALDMMLSGKSIDAKRARRMNLADECVPPRVMENAARMLVVSNQAQRELSLWQKLLNGPLRGIVLTQAKKQVMKRAHPEHYPAPYALLDIWAHYGGNALAVPADEPSSLDAIFFSPTTKNLIRVFFLQERLKSLGKDSKFAARHVHVVGAGVMGGDIAAWCALSGMTVTLQDQTVERIAPAIARAAKLFEKKLRNKRAAHLVLDRLIPDPYGSGVGKADVVIEAIFENLEAKHGLLKAIEPQLKSTAILASNTSSLKLADIASVLKDPRRLVGIHFFNPVAMMPLVEVVAGANTDPVAAANAAAFVRSLDKLPLPVRDEPGFLVNAVLAPYLHEAMRCVDEGMPPATVDAAALAFGMPMGPLELADTVGLDVALAAGKQLVADVSPPRRLNELVAGGKLGKKTGIGFYVYAEGKPRKAAAAASPAGLTTRLLQPLLAATQQLVLQGVVADADLADAGVIFGTGFAPYTGGPMNYLREKHQA